jgi:hypothetical protein
MWLNHFKEYIVAQHALVIGFAFRPILINLAGLDREHRSSLSESGGPSALRTLAPHAASLRVPARELARKMTKKPRRPGPRAAATSASRGPEARMRHARWAAGRG